MRRQDEGGRLKKETNKWYDGKWESATVGTALGAFFGHTARKF